MRKVALRGQIAATAGVFQPHRAERVARLANDRRQSRSQFVEIGLDQFPAREIPAGEVDQPLGVIGVPGGAADELLVMGLEALGGAVTHTTKTSVADVAFEDDDALVVVKPAGLHVHPLGDRRALLSSLDRFRRDVDSSGMMDGLDAYSRQAFGILTSSKLVEALDVPGEGLLDLLVGPAEGAA